MHHLIYWTGRLLGKRFRLWYTRRMGRWSWGLCRLLQEVPFPPTGYEPPEPWLEELFKPPKSAPRFVCASKKTMKALAQLAKEKP